MKRTALFSGAAGLLLLTGCAGDPSSDADLTIAAAFYPLQFVAEQVGGEHVDVIALAQPGVEPHDLELSPVAVRQLNGADLALYLSDFQPAVDAAIAATDTPAFDAATTVSLHESEHGRTDSAQEGDGGEHDHGDHDHGEHDPHFWLDPTLLATYATAVGEEFAQLDPANAGTYTANAQALAAQLHALDEQFTTGLANCERDTIVTSHEAFGYLAEHYGLTQIGIAGLDPETEPSPARLLQIRNQVEATGTTTIFTESLVSTSVADAIARDTGATVAVLDPVEAVTGDDDYPAVMARNLDTLRDALGCV